jgi:hypothetical protein
MRLLSVQAGTLSAMTPSGRESLSRASGCRTIRRRSGATRRCRPGMSSTTCWNGRGDAGGNFIDRNQPPFPSAQT